MLAPFHQDAANNTSIGSFYAFILDRSDRVRLTVVARSNYEAIKNNVCTMRHVLLGGLTISGYFDQEWKPWGEYRSASLRYDLELAGETIYLTVSSGKVASGGIRCL